MTRRAKHPRVYALLGLKRNMITGDYDIIQAGVTYSMHLEMTRQLKKFCTDNYESTLAEWYATLNQADKKKVTRAGDVEDKSEPFYSDPIYD